MRPLHFSPKAAEFLLLKTRSELATWLGTTDKKLRYLLYVLEPSKKYRSFDIAKRNGGLRRIDAPHRALKVIQSKIQRILVELAPASGIAKGYVQGISIIEHAHLHRRQRYVVFADIEGFFPAITFARVRGALMARPLNLEASVATCIAQLCCKDGVLPQGAPTSPVLSNLICRSLDHNLTNFARRYRLKVSRYADDICFSTSKPTIPDELVDTSGVEPVPGAGLKRIVTDAGFSINHSKFKVRSCVEQQLVTGLVVNRGVSLPRHWRRQLRVIFHLIDRHGVAKAKEVTDKWRHPAASRRGCQSLEQLVRGKTHFAQYVDRRCGRQFSDSLYRSYSRARNLMPRPLNGIGFRVMSEGKTDLQHLEAACKWFQARGEFLELRPRFVNFLGESGDIELLKTLERIAKSDISELTIGIFDCDNPKLMAKEGLAPSAARQLGARVYAMCLGQPSDLTGEPFCIELLYPHAQLTQFTPSSRRIFLPSEFNPISGLTTDGKFYRQYPKATSLIVSDNVVRVADGYSSLLSKVDFAEMVASKNKPFDEMDFSGFEPTLHMLRKIIDHVYGR